MNLIAAVDQHWGIGRGNQLLVRIPRDLKQFQQETYGKVVIYGRKTLEVLPSGQPLIGRTNIILSKNPSFTVRNAVIKHSVEETLDYIHTFPSQDVYVIGGESIYRAFLPYCDLAHITHIDRTYDADRYFPNLAETGEWKVTDTSDELTYFDIAYHFVQYERTERPIP
ncbi:MAG: dihydrofolate reductase [Clostridium sp.]|jgi:dihydrofolate reductase|nr:dihydrofolate reductase [Clostridium sp.]